MNQASENDREMEDVLANRPDPPHETLEFGAETDCELETSSDVDTARRESTNGILLLVGIAALGGVAYATNVFSLFDGEPVTVDLNRSQENEQPATPPAKERAAAMEAAREMARRRAATTYRRRILDIRFHVAGEQLQKTRMAFGPEFPKAVQRLAEPDADLQHRLAHESVFHEFVRFFRNELPGQTTFLENQKEYRPEIGVEERRMLVVREALEDPRNVELALNELDRFDKWYRRVLPSVMYYKAVTGILAAADGLPKEDVPETTVGERLEELVAAEIAVWGAETSKGR